MRILVVDEHAVVRVGIRSVLGEALEDVVFGEAASSAEALDRVRDHPWDIATLGLSMPGRGGLETITEIHALRAELPVLVFTMHAEDPYALRAFRAGAAGYLSKGRPLAELVAAVRKVAGGGKYVTESVAEALATHLGPGGKHPREESLSDRELQVLLLLGAGRTNKEIGIELSLSVKTVSTYRTRILEKMQMRTTAQLVRYVVASRFASDVT